MGVLPTTFGIFGTCDSVDIFDFNSNDIISNHTPMRAGSILTADISRTDKNISNFWHSSNLAVMLLHIILNGQIFEFMDKEAGEYLIIDLVEERMPFIKFEEKMFLYSPWFRDSNLKEIIEADSKVDFIDHEQFEEEFLESRIRLFCDRILEIYPEKNIIINEVILSDKYVNEQGMTFSFEREEYVKWSYKSKSIIKKMYIILEKNLPNAKILKMKNTCLADANNKRGLSPCHFVLDWYKDRYNQLLHLIENDYKEKRKIETSELKLDGKLSARKRKLEKTGVSGICAYFLGNCMQFTEFKNKKVLWIGGPTINHDVVRKMQISKFVFLTTDKIAIPKEIQGENILNFTDKYISPRNILENHNFAYYSGGVEDLTEDFCDFFDVVCALNIMEYTNNFPVFLDNIYKCLRRGGKFFAKPGRIWSAPYGTEWKVNSSLSYLVSKNNEIPYFSHLLLKTKDITELLEKKRIDKNTIAILTHEILNGHDGMNRLFYEDYIFYLKNSLFSFKGICPMGKVYIEEDILNKLSMKYEGYTHFEFNTFFMFCEK